MSNANAKKARTSRNLFDKSVGTTGMMLGDGSIVANANYLISAYIPAIQGTYSYSFIIGYPNARFFTRCFYDENQNYLSGERIVISNAQIGEEASTTFSAPAGTAYIRICIHNQNGDGDYPMFNSGLPLSYEPYGEMFFDVPCAVKRYTSIEEMNTSVWQKTYKANTLTKNGADLELRIDTTSGRGASVSTDQFYKDNCAIKLAANETYSIDLTNNIDIGEAKVVVRYLDTNEIITSVRYGELPESITLTPNVETYIYFGVDISEYVIAQSKTAKINVIRQPAWHDTPVYVRQNGVWVVQT